MSVNGDGTLHYTPNAGFSGADTISYTVTDGTLSDGGQVAVTVNDTAPVAVDDTASTSKGTAVDINVLGNDTDADGDTLSISGTPTALHGTVSVNGDGTLHYTPNAGFSGSDTISYAVTDGTLSDGGQVAVTVSDTAPVAVDDTASTSKGAAIDINVLGNDTDADGDALAISGTPTALHGTVSVNGDGTLHYTPNAGYTGADTISYTVTDGTLSDTGAVAVTVSDTAPVAVGDNYTTSTGVALNIGVGAGVLANDTDADGDALSAVLVSGPSHGVLSLNANGSFNYTPDAGFTGSDSFSYMANDGSADSGQVTAAITVNPAPPVNVAPVAGNDEYAGSRSSKLTVDAAHGLLFNDSDANGDALSVVLVSGPSNGSLSLNADGSFTYTPRLFFGPNTVSFQYAVTDGQTTSNTATVTLDLSKAIPTDPSLVAVDDTYSTIKATALSVDAAHGLLANDSDPDGDPLSAVLVSGPGNGSLSLNGDGSFTFTPSSGFTGTTSFTYRVDDGSGQSALATATINVTNADGSTSSSGWPFWGSSSSSLFSGANSSLFGSGAAPKALGKSAPSNSIAPAADSLPSPDGTPSPHNAPGGHRTISDEGLWSLLNHWDGAQPAADAGLNIDQLLAASSDAAAATLASLGAVEFLLTQINGDATPPPADPMPLDDAAIEGTGLPDYLHGFYSEFTLF